jgi:exodeoxyribonuclease VII large subunit
MKRRPTSARRAGAPEPELFSWPFTEEDETRATRPPAPAPRHRAPPVEVIPGTTPESAIPVSALAEMAKAMIEGAFIPVWIRGEITDFKAHRNGHWYFCLRDAASQLKCVVWSRDQHGIPAPPDEGMQVVALGQLSFYAARGEVQLTVRQIDAEGDGLWRKAMERTRARLDADGLLRIDRKRSLPLFPRRIAVVTSPDGAALRDIIAVARRRCALVEIVVVSARVQGDGAIDDLCRALEAVARWGEADVVIIGRGGGGREDLWAFNDERLARAVAACPIPTISAVGHEIDTTICDLVADVRAATPSAAAECAVPVLDDLRAGLSAASVRLAEAMFDRLDWARRSMLDARERLISTAGDALDAKTRQMREVAARLHDLSPIATLARGYAAARGSDGRTLGSVTEFAPGGTFELLLRDGVVDASTIAVRPTPVPAARDESAA